jgi:type II secretory pathway component HofQ
MEATFPQVETRVFKNLGVIVLKSKDQEALAKAEKLIKQIQSKDVEISPEDNFMVKDGLIYVYAENANLVAVMKRIAKSLGISLMVPEELDETFTLTLEGVTWDTFVAAIQECEPVKIEKVNDIYIVRKKEIVSEAPTDDATGEQIYRVYHNIEELKTLIEFYGGTVYADSVNGILVVKGLPKSRVLELMEQVSGTFTSPKKQVKIETRIVDKSLLDDITKQFSTSLGFEQPNILFNSGSLNLSFSILDSVDFAKLLKNLITGSATVTAQLEKSNVDGSIISNPSIVALSGEEARIHIGDTIPILLKKIDPATGNIVEELQYLETGVEMTITPTVKDDGIILLDLYIKVSEPQPYANDLYGEKTREAKTKLVISDGNTLTIGGLVSERENVSVTKLPFFGDLPFIGKLFRAEKTTKEQREMVIFITAMVVEP